MFASMLLLNKKNVAKFLLLLNICSLWECGVVKVSEIVERGKWWLIGVLRQFSYLA